MAPFMVIGRGIRNRFGWPSLRLKGDPLLCADCKNCTGNCPMSLDVNAMVQANQMEHSECILCGTCVDNCASKAIHFTFSSGK
jgi:ferredoxin-type protein NapH